jgi:outer membrane protein TolC
MRILVLVFTVLSGPAFASTEGSGPGRLFADADRLVRGDLVQAVLDRSPTVDMARQAWQAALQREPQARSLDDPVVSYSLAPLSIGASNVRYGQVVRFGQRLPFPGKLKLQGEIARAEAEAAHQDYQAVRLRLATMASLLFDNYYFVHRALEINDEHLQLLRDFQRIATVRYTAGRAAQQDPIQAEVEVAHLLHREVVLQTERRTIGAQINALLHRPPEEDLPAPPPSLDLPEMEGLDPARLQELALQSRPELRANEVEIQAGAAAVKLREKDSNPDFEAMTSYNSMWGVAEHRWLVGVGIHLPLWRKGTRAGVAEVKVRLSRAESRRLELVDAIRAEVYIAYQRLEEAEHVVELYRSRLLPASGDQVRAALTGFETGQNSFLALIEAERNRRTIQLDYEAALADFYRRRAELDRSLGRIPSLVGTEENLSEMRNEPRAHALEGGLP